MPNRKNKDAPSILFPAAVVVGFILLAWGIIASSAAIETKIVGASMFLFFAGVTIAVSVIDWVDYWKQDKREN